MTSQPALKHRAPAVLCYTSLLRKRPGSRNCEASNSAWLSDLRRTQPPQIGEDATGQGEQMARRSALFGFRRSREDAASLDRRQEPVPIFLGLIPVGQGKFANRLLENG